MKSIKKNLVIICVFLVVLFIFSLFGKENLIVGFGTFLIAVTLFNDDYTVNALRNVVYFAVLQMAIGLLAYLGSLNIVFGGISVFIVTLYIYYNFTYNTKISKATGFITSYLLLLYIPITKSQLPVRLMALALSGVLIMVLYYLIAGKKYLKGTIEGLKNSIDTLSSEIEMLLRGEDIKKINLDLGRSLNTLENRLLNTIGKLSNLDLELERRYALFTLIKRLNIILLRLNGTEVQNKEFLEFINKSLKNLLEISNSNEEISKILKSLESFNLKIVNKNAYYVVNVFEDMKELLEALEAINNNKFSYLGNKRKFRELYKSIYNATFKNKELKSLRKIGSLKWNFAIKSSIMMTIAYIIVSYFKIPEGKWLLFTIGVVSLPFGEQITKKGRDRIIGTIIGVIAFNLVYTFVQYKIVIIALLIISVFCMLSITDYSKKAIFITFMSLSMASLALDNPFRGYYILSMERLIFVIIGSLIPYLISRIFPYSLEGKTKELKKDLVTLVYKIEKGVEDKSMTFEERYKRVIKLGTLMKYTCSKLYFNNTALNSSEINKVLRLENEFIMDLYYLIKNIKRENFKFIDEKREFVLKFKNLSEEEKRKEFYTLQNEDRKLLINLLNLKHSTEAMKKIIE